MVLNKSQHGFIYVNDDTRKKVLIGHIVVRPNSDESVVISTFSDNNGISGTELGDLVGSFSGNQNKTQVVYQLALEEENNEKVKYLKDAWIKTGSVLKIEWDNGAIFNYSFSKTNAI